MRSFVALAILLLALGTTAPVEAQRVGTLAQWKKRVLDPASIGLEIFPGSQRNLKFTIDNIRLDETTAQMAIYLISTDQMPAAAEFYAKQLGRPVEESGVGTMGELRTVRADPADLKRAGLTVRVEHAQWATGQGQVWLRYDPPGGS
jgi:hypothetical protein